MRSSSINRAACVITGFAVACVGLATAADTTALPQRGKADIKSAGPLAFGPDGILFVGDPQGAVIFAINTSPPATARAVGELSLKGIDQKVASLLGTTSSDIQINDLAVQPTTGLVYLSVSRGLGPHAQPAIIKVDGLGQVSELPLDEVSFAKVSLKNAPAEEAKDGRGASLRTESITDLAYIDGKLFIAGLSNEEFASKLRSIPFPFHEVDPGTSVEIYHGAHGKFETRAPVRTFVPFNIEGKPHILAAYTCTPLVKFPLSDLKPGEKIQGVTVAELGNRNRPLDLIVYQKEGVTHLLLANSARGVLKITTDHLNDQTPITSKVADTAGLKHEAIQHLKGVVQLDKLNDQLAIVLVQSDAGSLSLESIPLP